MSSTDNKALKDATDAEQSDSLKVKVKFCASNCGVAMEKDNDMLTCHTCCKSYLLACTSFNKDVYESIKVNNYFDEVAWNCPTCKDKASLVPSIHAMMEMINVLQTRFSTLENSLTRQTEPVAVKSTSVKSAPSPMAKHTLMVTPKDANTFSSEGWNTVVKKSVLPKLKNVQISKAVTTKSGKNILFFPTAEARNAAQKKLCEDEAYNVEAQDKKSLKLLPKMKVCNIPKSCIKDFESNKAGIKQLILEKNPTIKHLIEVEKKLLDIIFVADERDPEYCFAVIKIDSEIKNAIKNQQNKLYLGLVACRVVDRYHIIQCYKCQRFGHKMDSEFCPLQNTDEVVCLYCSKNHQSKTCPVKREGSPESYKCNNCATSNSPQEKLHCGGHTTTSPMCPVLQKALKSTMNRTVGVNYTPNVSKNLIIT